MKASTNLEGDDLIQFETLITKLQIIGTKLEKNEKLINLALNALELVIEQEKGKTGKRYPSYTDLTNALSKGQFELDTQ